jgi:hypothetical protein|tara:strand:+ start:1144 stop:1362 length:219 start_codon:yes stop_codon:yes gene_type:complete
MDSKLDNIKNLIKEKKDKYPNISNVWLKYIEEKEAFFNKSLEHAEKTFLNIENTLQNDLPMETIAILFLLNQ